MTAPARSAQPQPSIPRASWTTSAPSACTGICSGPLPDPLRSLAVRRALLACLIALVPAGSASAAVDQESVLQDDPLIVYPRSKAALESTLVDPQGPGRRPHPRVRLLEPRRAEAGQRAQAQFRRARRVVARCLPVRRLGPLRRHRAAGRQVPDRPALHRHRPGAQLGRQAIEAARYSVYKPSAREFRAFVTAVGRRYSGNWTREADAPYQQPPPPTSLTLPVIGPVQARGAATARPAQAGRTASPCRPLVDLERAELPELALAAVTPDPPARIPGQHQARLAAPLPGPRRRRLGGPAAQRPQLGRRPPRGDRSSGRARGDQHHGAAGQVPARALLRGRRLQAVPRPRGAGTRLPEHAGASAGRSGGPTRACSTPRAGPTIRTASTTARRGGTPPPTRSRSAASAS